MMREEKSKLFVRLIAVCDDLQALVDDNTTNAEKLRFDLYAIIDALRGQFCEKLFRQR